MQHKYSIIAILLAMSAINANFQPFDQNRINQNIIQIASQQSLPAIKPSDTSINNTTISDLVDKINRFEADNYKLRSREACQQATWTVASTTLNLAQATVELDVCKANLKAMSAGDSKIVADQNLSNAHNVQVLQDDNTRLSDMLYSCNADLEKAKKEGLALMDKINAVKLQGYAAAVNNNVMYNRDLDRYFNQQTTMQIQMQSLLSTEKRQQDMISALGKKLNQINAGLRTAADSVDKCRKNDILYQACDIEFQQARFDVQVFGSRLNTVNVSNASLNETITALKAKIAELSAVRTVISTGK